LAKLGFDKYHMTKMQGVEARLPQAFACSRAAHAATGVRGAAVDCESRQRQ